MQGIRKGRRSEFADRIPEITGARIGTVTMAVLFDKEWTNADTGTRFTTGLVSRADHLYAHWAGLTSFTKADRFTTMPHVDADMAVALAKRTVDDLGGAAKILATMLEMAHEASPNDTDSEKFRAWTFQAAARATRRVAATIGEATTEPADFVNNFPDLALPARSLYTSAERDALGTSDSRRAATDYLEKIPAVQAATLLSVLADAATGDIEIDGIDQDTASRAHDACRQAIGHLVSGAVAALADDPRQLSNPALVRMRTRWGDSKVRYAAAQIAGAIDEGLAFNRQQREASAPVPQPTPSELLPGGPTPKARPHLPDWPTVPSYRRWAKVAHFQRPAGDSDGLSCR